MRVGKLVRATRSKTAANGEQWNEGRPGGGQRGDLATAAADNAESNVEATAAATASASATAATGVTPVSEVRRTQRKRSRTQLYAAGEAAAAGGNKKTKKSARLATVLNREKEECASPPEVGRDQDADGDAPSKPKAVSALLDRPEARVETKVVVRLSLSGQNMTVWNRLRAEFGARDDHQVLERLLSSYSTATPNSIKKKSKQDPR